MSKLDLVSDVFVLRDLRRMTALAVAKPQDDIVVVGGRSLDYGLALLRCGFDNALCLAARRPRPCAETVDHLFICDRLDDVDLAAVVRGWAARLRPGGRLVAHLADVAQDGVIRAELQRLGLGSAPARFDVARGVLVSHAIAGASTLARAA